MRIKRIALVSALVGLTIAVVTLSQTRTVFGQAAAFSCCTRTMRCQLPGPQPTGSLCYCRSYYGPIPGTACP